MTKIENVSRPPSGPAHVEHPRHHWRRGQQHCRIEVSLNPQRRNAIPGVEWQAPVDADDGGAIVLHQEERRRACAEVNHRQPGRREGREDAARVGGQYCA